MDIWEKSCFLHCVHRTWRWILPGNKKKQKQSYPMCKKKSLKVTWTQYWAVTVSSDRQSITKRALTKSGSLPKARTASTQALWACPAASGRARTGTRATRTAGPAARQSRGTRNPGLNTIAETDTDDLWHPVTHGHISEIRSLLPQFSNHRKLVYKNQYKQVFQRLKKKINVTQL